MDALNSCMACCETRLTEDVAGLHALGREIPYKTRDASTHGKGSLSNTLRVLIAFALVERTETQDVSPTSSRSSRQSFPLHLESLDTLRIHSVIQRYFIEHLAAKAQHAYWLERSVAVFSKSYEEADRRISEQPKVGLPDDYRRFYIHGKKLVEHIKRYERRHPELQSHRIELEAKLEEIHGKVHGLSSKIQAMIVDKSDEIAQTSIFDRTNSLSESDSATSSSQSQSQQDTWAQMDDDDPRFYHSPAALAPDQHYDAYGLPFPYPDGSTIPAMPFQYEDEHERTPQITPKVGQVSPDPDQNGWTTVVQHHNQQKPRTDYLINQRGHHKSDSEIGISHDIARSPFFHTSSPRGGSRSSSKGRLSAHSEAELALQKMRKVSPPNPRGGRAVQDKGRSLSSSTATRPRDIMTRGEHNYARVASGLTPTDKSPPAEFYRGSGGEPVSASSWTAETVKRFKESLRPAGRKSSTGSSNSKTAPTSGSVQTSPGTEEVATMPPFPQVSGTRTARSSPGGVTPFYPPGFPVEQLIADARRNNPPNLHQWNTSSYTPGLGRLEATNLPRAQHGFDQDANAVPYPFPPNIWFPAPDAVSAAPMSRNSSQQSSSQSSAGRRRGGNLALATSSTALRGRRHSSPLSSPIRSAPPPGSLVPVRGHSRPPSVVTEPSPRLRPRHDVPEMPAGQARVYLPEPLPLPRPRAGSNTPGAAVRPRWYKRASGRLRARTQSQSPSAVLRVSGGASVHSAGSPDPGSAVEAGGEAMARSGSGGIVVGDGRIVGFGELPVSADHAKEAVRAPPMSRSSSGGVGLGIMHETE